jgi:hypothetical protein
MDSTSAEKAIKDCGLPGRVVEVDKNLITLDLLNDRTERLERHELGLSDFCDLLLDWRQKLIARADPGGTRVVALPPQKHSDRDREAEPSSV